MPCARVRPVALLHFVLAVWMQHHCAAFHLSMNKFVSKAVRRSTTVASATATSDDMVRSKGYWDAPRDDVPEKVLEAIRQEPWRGLFEPCVEHELTEIEVDGIIPQGLEGTLFRNGAGRNREGDRLYGHWFDGDGHVAKVVFKDGKAYAQNRFVATDCWDPDAPEGQRSWGTVRGWTPRPGGWLKNVFKLPGNVRNTSVMLKGGKLYALAEGGKPAEMDPITLETIGESDIGGIKAAYSAHPSTDPDTGETYNIGIGGEGNTLEITRLSPAGALDKSASFAPPGTHFWHDNAITEDYIVAITSPFVAKTKAIVAALLGFSPLAKAFQWDSSVKSEAFFFSKDTLELVKKIELPGICSSYHLVNAYQDDEDSKTVTVWVCKLQGDREKLEDTFMDLMGRRFTDDVMCKSYKYKFDLQTGEVLSHGSAPQTQGELPMELPTIDSRYIGKPAQYVYTAAKKGDVGFFNCVQRGDVGSTSTAAWSTHDFGEMRFSGEPIFVPKGEDVEEGEGYLIVPVYNARAHTTDMEVLDAQGLEGPPICVAHVPWHLGSSFHGIFTPHVYL